MIAIRIATECHRMRPGTVHESLEAVSSELCHSLNKSLLIHACAMILHLDRHSSRNLIRIPPPFEVLIIADTGETWAVCVWHCIIAVILWCYVQRQFR